MLQKIEKGSVRTTVMLVAGLVIFILAGIFVFRSPSVEQPVNDEENGEDISLIDDDEEKEEDEDKQEFEDRLKETLNNFIGSPHITSPLDEDTLYTEDGFNSTTLILSMVAKTYSPEEPEDIMKELNYYPAGAVSFLNRNHFSSYRNKVSRYFADITSDVGGEDVKQTEVTLNKVKEDGNRLIDINWEEEVTLAYIPREKVEDSLESLPSVAGVMFYQEGDVEIGLDVRGEGIVLDGEEFVYSSSTQGEVIKVDFLKYFAGTAFDGVIFYEFNKI